MNNDQKILDNLSAANMHVHEISDDVPVPFHVCNWDTHFIMKGADIVCKGSLKTIESFALRLSNNPI